MEFANMVSRKKSECGREYLGETIAGTIVLVDLINSGSFGDIYHGRDSNTGAEYAVKFNKNETERGVKSFHREYDFMKQIEGRGLFPKCTILLRHKNKLDKDILIMDKLGPNVFDLFRICDKSLSPQSVCILVQHFIARAQELHDCGIVHRDVKPENFCLSNPLDKQFYLIDFGLSKEFMDDDCLPKAFAKNEGFIGTPRYASRYAHRGKPLSPGYSQIRRDDLESIGYMCVFLMKGALPWQSIKTKDKKEKHKALYKYKAAVNLEQLCADLPKEFAKYLEVVRSLEYEDEPPYDDLIDMFKKLAKNINPMGVFDWENKAEVGYSHPSISSIRTSGFQNTKESSRQSRSLLSCTLPRKRTVCKPACGAPMK